MGKTITEKIFSHKTNKDLEAGDIAVVDIDFSFSQDGTSNLVIDSFLKLGAEFKMNPKNYAFVIDHSIPAPNKEISNIHKRMREFSKEYGFSIYEGEGVCHQVILERGHIFPGGIVTGADSHTCTYGALNAFSCGMGSTDIAVILATGKNWFRIPESIKIIIKGKIPKGIFAKDIILYIIKNLNKSVCNYKAIEFCGEVIDELEMDERFTLTNMVIELNAKAGLMEIDEKAINWLKPRYKGKFERFTSDSNACYSFVKEFDISSISPQVAKPHEVSNISDIEEVVGTKIDQGFIGTCTNGRLSDLKIAAEILNGKKISKDVKLIIAPASREILKSALETSIIDIFINAGALLIAPGCGPCVGTHGGIPADTQVVISTANRNFKGRMGNPNSYIYLASPATVAASCIAGEIIDPRRYL
jgi:3-isopropylmalate/(R)-2-methylmalate dehydratase large subunit